jgi:hypothetical protein
MEQAELRQAELLCQPSNEAVSRYFNALRKNGHLPEALEVRADAGGKGKGIFVRENHTIEEGDVVLHEHPLVAAQHCVSRCQVISCATCFKSVGGIEKQVLRNIKEIELLKRAFVSFL